MLIAILVGTIIGFVLAIPPGPVSVTAAKLTVFTNRRAAMQLSYATALVDAIFALSAVFTATAVFSYVSQFTTSHKLLTQAFQFSVVIGFIIFGIINLTKKKVEIQEGIPAKRKFLDHLAHKGPFFFGIAVALSNLANPTFLPTLGYIAIQVKSFNLFEMDFFNKVWFSLGFGFGNFFWLYVMTGVLHLNKDRMSDKFTLRLRQFAGVTFLSFGTLLGFKIVKFIQWQEIIRLVFVF